MSRIVQRNWWSQIKVKARQTSYLSITGNTPASFPGTIAAYPHIHCIDFVFNSHATRWDISTEPVLISFHIFFFQEWKASCVGFVWPNIGICFQASQPLTSFRISTEKKHFEGEICLMLKTATVRHIHCVPKEPISCFLLQGSWETMAQMLTWELLDLTEWTECHVPISLAFFFSFSKYLCEVVTLF